MEIIYARHLADNPNILLIRNETWVTGKTMMLEENSLEAHLWDSAGEAFETTIMMSIQRAEAAAKAYESAESIIGSISFKGPLEGSLTVKCDTESAARIAKSMMMMEESDSIEIEEVEDAIGEVVNLVLGGVKSRLLESVGEIDISVPTVITGTRLEPKVRQGSKKLSVRANSDKCELEMAIIYKENKS